MCHEDNIVCQLACGGMPTYHNGSLWTLAKDCVRAVLCHGEDYVVDAMRLYLKERCHDVSVVRDVESHNRCMTS